MTAKYAAYGPSYPWAPFPLVPGLSGRGQAKVGIAWHGLVEWSHQGNFYKGEYHDNVAFGGLVRATTKEFGVCTGYATGKDLIYNGIFRGLYHSGDQYYGNIVNSTW